jgi:hypothetical protein
VGD